MNSPCSIFRNTCDTQSRPSKVSKEPLVFHPTSRNRHPNPFLAFLEVTKDVDGFARKDGSSSSRLLAIHTAQFFYPVVATRLLDVVSRILTNNSRLSRTLMARLMTSPDTPSRTERIKSSWLARAFVGMPSASRAHLVQWTWLASIVNMISGYSHYGRYNGFRQARCAGVYHELSIKRRVCGQFLIYAGYWCLKSPLQCEIRR